MLRVLLWWGDSHCGETSVHAYVRCRVRHIQYSWCPLRCMWCYELPLRPLALLAAWASLPRAGAHRRSLTASPCVSIANLPQPSEKVRLFAIKVIAVVTAASGIPHALASKRTSKGISKEHKELSWLILILVSMQWRIHHLILICQMWHWRIKQISEK